MKKYIIIRTKNNLNFFIKDGFIKYEISFTPKISCPCHKKIMMCDHIIYILKNEFILSDFVIRYLHLIYNDFITNSYKKKFLNNILELKLINKFNSEDCGFCLNKLGDKNYDYQLSECSVCHIITHKKCMDIWKKGCIICRPFADK